MNRPLALDTSVAVPLLVDTHPEHALVVDWRDSRDVVLCGHAAVETFSVLTRLPRDARLSPGDAARLIGARFGSALPLSVETFRVLPDLLAGRGVQGGAVYDALVGLAAVEHGADLATRDVRARGTYEAVGARVVMLG